MAISRAVASSITQGLPKQKTMLAGNSTILPGSYESIQTYTVGAGGSSSVTFSSIPATYSHLQIRFFAQTNRGTYGSDDIYFRVGNGSIDSGANYSWHDLYGNGASAASQSLTSQTKIELDNASGTGVASNFGAGVLDILDYANTNKYKTTRSLHGNDVNGTISGFGGRVALDSGSWRNTAAITTIQFGPVTGTSFNQYSSFALYGIK